MAYSNLLKLLAIILIFSSISFQQSFSLTEAVDLFGNTNSVDLILNDIWIEPENPKNGESVTIHGSVYNAGIISSSEVSNVVTIGYIVNGELVEITLLENILPGLENGIIISSGPVFDAIPGTYTITVVINYHDTLSHLRDNPSNNIVQRSFIIGQESPIIISSNTYQLYNSKIDKQKIRIEGKVTNIFEDIQANKEVILNLAGIIKDKATTDDKGDFSFEIDIPFNNKIFPVETKSNTNEFISNAELIFPIKLNSKQSALSLEIIPDVSRDNFDEFTIDTVIFQDSYDKLFKQISNKEHKEQNLQFGNFFLTPLPANHEYIVEVYFEGRIVDAFQNSFQNNEVINRNIQLVESAQVQFKVTDDKGNPQENIKVENWIYSGTTDSEGLTEKISTLPNFTNKEPYAAKAIFPDGTIKWSEKFTVSDSEEIIIEIIREDE